MNIEKITYIKRQTLTESAYLESLLEKAADAKLITESDIEKVQDGCLELLEHNLRRALGDYSDSVSEERAQFFMDSIIYTLGVGLKTFKNPDDALDFLLQNGVERVYLQGMKRIGEMLLGIKDMLDSLQSSIPENASKEYIYTVTKVLPTFLKKYNPEIAAHDCILYPDYPVDLPIEMFSGIEYIFAYTAALLQETKKRG